MNFIKGLSRLQAPGLRPRQQEAQSGPLVAQHQSLPLQAPTALPLEPAAATVRAPLPTVPTALPIGFRTPQLQPSLLAMPFHAPALPLLAPAMPLRAPAMAPSTAAANLAPSKVPPPPATASASVPQLAIGSASAGNSSEHLDAPSAFQPVRDLAPAGALQQGSESTSSDKEQMQPPQVAASRLRSPLKALQPAAPAQSAHAPEMSVAGALFSPAALPEFEVAIKSAAPSPQAKVSIPSGAGLSRGPADRVAGPKGVLQSSKQPAPPQDSGRLQPNAPQELAADVPRSTSAFPPSRQPAAEPDEQRHRGLSPAFQPAAPAERTVQNGAQGFGEQILYPLLAKTPQNLPSLIIVAGDQYI